MTPPLFFSAIFLAWYVLKCRDECKRTQQQQDGDDGQRHRRELANIQKARSAAAVRAVIFIAQLMYPKLCTRTFQMFRCIDMGPSLGKLLEADFSKRCYEGVHGEYIPFAIVSVVVYLVGVPLLTFAIIWRNRHRLHARDVECYYGDLYRQVRGARIF